MYNSIQSTFYDFKILIELFYCLHLLFFHFFGASLWLYLSQKLLVWLQFGALVLWRLNLSLKRFRIFIIYNASLVADFNRLVLFRHVSIKLKWGLDVTVRTVQFDFFFYHLALEHVWRPCGLVCKVCKLILRWDNFDEMLRERYSFFAFTSDWLGHWRCPWRSNFLIKRGTLVLKGQL